MEVFAQHLYCTALVLHGAKKLTNLDAKIALLQAISLFQHLQIALAGPLAGSPTITHMNTALKAVSRIFKSPMVERTCHSTSHSWVMHTKKSNPSTTAATNNSTSKPIPTTTNNTTGASHCNCYNCGSPEHFANWCLKAKRHTCSNVLLINEGIVQGDISDASDTSELGNKWAELN